MDEERSASQVSWGARINMREGHDVSDFPAWANPPDRERWTQKGVIIWQEETQHIVRLFATYALQLLDALRNDDAWKEQGIIVGEPVFLLPWGKQGHTSEPGLHNPIHLSPRQAKALLRLLERNQTSLENLKEQEDKD